MNDALEVFEPVSTTPIGHRILHAATELFRERGIMTTSVDSIVERAGTTKRTFYQRFGSKDLLVACYLRQRAHVWQVELLEALGDVPPAIGLSIIYQHAAQWSSRNPRGCAFVNAWAEIGASDHEAADVVRAEKAWMLALFTHIAGGDSSRGALLHVLYEGAQVTASVQGERAVFNRTCAASQALLAQ